MLPKQSEDGFVSLPRVDLDGKARIKSETAEPPHGKSRKSALAWGRHAGRFDRRQQFATVNTIVWRHNRRTAARSGFMFKGTPLILSQVNCGQQGFFRLVSTCVIADAHFVGNTEELSETFFEC